jgi:hypothetical protein
LTDKFTFKDVDYWITGLLWLFTDFKGKVIHCPNWSIRKYSILLLKYHIIFSVDNQRQSYKVSWFYYKVLINCSVANILYDCMKHIYTIHRRHRAKSLVFAKYSTGNLKFIIVNYFVKQRQIEIWPAQFQI